jgi:eukaryotic-like serine/threonine-protein kinase
MGEVWEATHEVTRKSVAIKVLNATYSQRPEVRARFLQEARAACRVRHPNVVQVHDVLDLPDGAPAMVMDFLKGESLAAKLEREHSIPIGPLATILVPVVDAMAVAHGLGIIHRDLKPDNLFLESVHDGTIVVKVLDFGIAKVARSEAERDNPALTGTGAVLGTPYYMSPEQTFGEKDLDHRADIWSFGIILYECLTGRRPTEADNFGQILKTITTGAIPPLVQVAPHVPADISDLVARMLRCARAERPELSEVLAVLRHHAGLPYTSQPIVIVSPGSGPTASRPDVATEAAPALTPGPAAPVLDNTAESFGLSQIPGLPRRPRRALQWAAVGACVIALGGGGYAKWRSAQPVAVTAPPSTSLAATPPSGGALVPDSPPPAASESPPPVASARLPATLAPITSARPVAPKRDRAPEAVDAGRPSTIPPPPPPPSANSASVGKLHKENPF